MREVIEVRRYVTQGGRDVFGEWLAALKDDKAAKILARIDRLATATLAIASLCAEVRRNCGLTGDLDSGFTPRFGQKLRLVACSGDKRTQSSDIRRAFEYLKDYWGRTS